MTSSFAVVSMRCTQTLDYPQDNLTTYKNRFLALESQKIRKSRLLWRLVTWIDNGSDLRVVYDSGNYLDFLLDFITKCDKFYYVMR